MKKFLSIITAALILCLSICPAVVSVSAGSFDDWTLGPDAEYLTHEGMTYYPVYVDFDIYFDYTSNGVPNLEFADDETRKTYDGTTVYASSSTDNTVVEVELVEDGYYYPRTMLYVAQSRVEEFENFSKGIADTYITDNHYYSSYSITADDYSEWVSGTSMKVKAIEVDHYDQYFIFAYDEGSGYGIECAMVLRDYSTDELYLLKYNDYDKSYFYSGGMFDTYSNKKVTLYKLENEALHQKLIACYDAEIEDDLDWLVVEEVNATVAAVFCSIVFGFVPFALMVFSTVMLIKLKDKKYCRTYIIMLVGSALVLSACIGVFLILI